MEPITDAQIRASFINCSKGEAKRLYVPRDLDAQPWEDLDFLGWVDPQSADRRYLVTLTEAGLVGIVLRSSTVRAGVWRRNMCSLCYTVHSGSGVALLAAPKAGAAGRRGDSTGLYLCSDLACSLYLRDKKSVASGSRIKETMSLEDQVARLRGNLEGFLRKVEQ